MESQIHAIPYDGFSCANSKTSDLCIRTLASTQKIIISPPRDDPDTENSTLTIASNAVSINGAITASGSLGAPDVQTLSLRLRKAAPSYSIASSVPREAARVRIAAQPATSTSIDADAADVVLVLPDPGGAPQATVFDLASSPGHNGRSLTVKNCLDVSVITVRVLGMDAAQLLRTVNIAPGGSTTLFGYFDQWS